jgi:quercetin dioxygenase-like cupin family protein
VGQNDYVVRGSEAHLESIAAVEGRALSAPALVRVLAEGEEMLVMEVTMPAGAASPPHVHDHESVGYVVDGRVGTVIDGVDYQMGPGDGFRHPRGVEHSMKAIGSEAVWIEVKSPPGRSW